MKKRWLLILFAVILTALASIALYHYFVADRVMDRDGMINPYHTESGKQTGVR